MKKGLRPLSPLGRESVTNENRIICHLYLDPCLRPLFAL